MRTRLRAPFPILSSDDLPAAVAFYRDLLGFAETYRFPAEGAPVFVTLSLDGRELGLADKSSEPLHGRGYGPPGGHRFELCVTADDVDAAVEHLRGAGVPVLVEPADQPWGERLAYVTDPDDNPIMLTGPGSPAA